MLLFFSSSVILKVLTLLGICEASFAKVFMLLAVKQGCSTSSGSVLTSMNFL